MTYIVSGGRYLLTHSLACGD